MAGVIQPNIGLVVAANTTADFGATTYVPAGKAESCCLIACLAADAAVDGYANVVVTDPTFPAPGYASWLLFNEPIRYRQPGGSPVLLQDFIVSAGEHLLVQNAAAAGGSALRFFLYNRWRFDA